jgi:hypothetical protein
MFEKETLRLTISRYCLAHTVECNAKWPAISISVQVRKGTWKDVKIPWKLTLGVREFRKSNRKQARRESELENYVSNRVEWNQFAPLFRWNSWVVVFLLIWAAFARDIRMGIEIEKHWRIQSLWIWRVNWNRCGFRVQLKSLGSRISLLIQRDRLTLTKDAQLTWIESACFPIWLLNSNWIPASSDFLGGYVSEFKALRPWDLQMDHRSHALVNITFHGPRFIWFWPCLVERPLIAIISPNWIISSSNSNESFNDIRSDWLSTTLQPPQP